MQTISPTVALRSLLILSFALFVTGCGHNGADVAELEAENNQLKAQIAELQVGKENQSAADNTETNASSQNAPKMKMTTEVPEGIATPNRLETRIGVLTSVDPA